MDIKHIQYFVAIYENGSILKAATQIYISQQALSKMLGSLERELEAPLFHRDIKGVTPTPLGKELYRSCQPLLKEKAIFDQHILQFISQNHGHIRIAVGAGIRYFSADSLWEQFFSDYPNMTYEFTEYENDDAYQMLEQNKVDVALVSDYIYKNDYVVSLLKEMPRLLIVPPEHPLYKQEVIRWDNLIGQRLVLSMNPTALEKLKSKLNYRSTPELFSFFSEALYMYENCRRDQLPGITISEYFSDIYEDIFPDLKMLHFEDDYLSYRISLVRKKNHLNEDVLAELSLYLAEIIN